jgi:hypothetical protein
MATILVNTNNVHRDETHSLKEQLKTEQWQIETLTNDEIIGLRSIVSYIINNRIGDKASELSYTDLLNLKNKLNNFLP